MGVMEELLERVSTSTRMRSLPTPTSTMLLMTTVGQTSKPRRLMMEQQPGRDPTPWLSLMEGSSTSTTMPMMRRDMSLRSSMMALLHTLKLLLAMEWLVMEWLMLPLLWLMLLLSLQQLPILLRSLLPILLLGMLLGRLLDMVLDMLLLDMVLDMELSVEYQSFQSKYLFMPINILYYLK